MRLVSSIFLLFAVLATVVLAWEKEDYEIFDLVSAVENAEGKGTTFYSWLDVPPTASAPEIARAYRKMSVKIHPDKNPNVKNAHERFARLGVVSSILRNAESRERYDFFYKNGVPKWRGTGYYYSRFRPGLGTVSVFLILFTTILQYIIQNINYKSDTQRVLHIIKEARLVAWGTKMVPLTGQRKVKVNLGIQRDEDGRPEGSKYIDMVVEGDAVYYLDTSSGAMHLIDDSIAVKPAFKNTWFPKLINYVIHRLTSTSSKKVKDSAETLNEAEGDESSDSSELPERHQPATKTGGKRRRTAKKH